MNYIGEHLLPGQLGHFFALLSLVASLVATIAYFKANKIVLPDEKRSWIRLARVAFGIETVAVFSIFVILYYIISRHFNEYFYVWNHSSRDLQPEYLLSCIWEDQSGSFLLWNIWHCVLGWILIRRSKRWEAPVMTVVNFAQFCIAAMLIGIYFFDQKIGSNPFSLLRNELNAPVLFANPNYLQFPKIYEGNDLNALLQNYWMVIHPPVLFLGFASTIVPFAYACAGLINKDHSWTKTVLPWTVFSAAVLGTGVMMGAAWAYESLSFGGYWAWDPVENASLVPWLILVAGMHCNLVYNHSSYSLKSTYLFYILAFSLVLYSTFLTRSGILGDTSVHAFVGADMTPQLLSFLLVFFIPAMILFFRRSKSMPVIKKEESSYSREFWMFIGSLVLFLSGIIIIAKTSTPVVNKIFGTNIAPPVDVAFSHNQVQIFIAIIIGVLTAVTQYLKYKDTPKTFFIRKIWLPTLIALTLSLLISFFGNVDYTKKGIGFLAAIHAAIFAAVYGVVANTGYIWLGLKGRLKAAGPSVAHIGFALFLLGVIISSAKKELLSINTTGIALFAKTDQQDPAENITLIKGIRTDMGKYHVTYVRDTANTSDRKKYFELKFEAKNGNENFYLYPDVLKNNKGQEGFSPNPDKRHYWNADIFAYVTSWLDASRNDTGTFRPADIKAGDTVFYSNGLIVLNRVLIDPAGSKHEILPGETAMILDMTVVSKDGIHYSILPGIALKENTIRNIPDTVIAQNLVVKFNKVRDEKHGLLEIGIKENRMLNDLMTLKVYRFPLILLVWFGIIVMVIGFVMSIVQRVRMKARVVRFQT